MSISFFLLVSVSIYCCWCRSRNHSIQRLVRTGARSGTTPTNVLIRDTLLLRCYSKGVCWHHCYSVCFTRRYCGWPTHASSLMQPSRTTWCSYNERRRTRKRRAHQTRTGKVDGRGGEEEAQEAQGLWGMLYADDSGVVA